MRKHQPFHRRSLIVLLVLLSVGVFGLGASKLSIKANYSADPITAWVVDDVTGAPIEGVHVIAAWKLLGGLEGLYPVGFVNVMETTTDSTGKFAFPGWGPKPHRGRGIIRDEAPLLIFFKSGYSSTGRMNSNAGRTAPEHMRSDWNGKKVPLHKTNLPAGADQSTVSHVYSLIQDVLQDDQCSWKAIPRFIWAFDQERQASLEYRNVGRLGPLQYLSDAYSKERCGSLKEYVMEHGR